MYLRQLVHNIRQPPPDSMVGHMTRSDGQAMRAMPFFTLVNLAWLFLWALLGMLSNKIYHAMKKP